jgi:hypothetical protein
MTVQLEAIMFQRNSGKSIAEYLRAQDNALLPC